MTSFLRNSAPRRLASSSLCSDSGQAPAVRRRAPDSGGGLRPGSAGASPAPGPAAPPALCAGGSPGLRPPRWSSGLPQGLPPSPTPLGRRASHPGLAPRRLRRRLPGLRPPLRGHPAWSSDCVRTAHRFTATIHPASGRMRSTALPILAGAMFPRFPTASFAPMNCIAYCSTLPRMSSRSLRRSGLTHLSVVCTGRGAMIATAWVT